MEDPTAGLTDKQKEKLIQFKKSMRDKVAGKYTDDDHYYLRWLGARNYDVKNAEKMLLEHLEWRREWEVDNLLNWVPPEVFLKCFPGGFSGFDKNGYPVYIEPFGTFDMKGLQMSAKKKDILKYCIYEMERMMKAMQTQTEKMGKRVDKVVVIEDWEGFGLKQIFTPGMRDIMSTAFEFMEKNYPGVLKNLFVVHPPSIMPLIWTIVKPFLSEGTKEKIQILCGNHAETLLKYIPADQLPKYYGGTLTDPDGNVHCLTKVRRGVTVPEKYFLSGKTMVEDESKVINIKIKGGAQEDIEIKVANQGEILKWIYWTDSGDISFGIYHKQEDGDLKVVESPERLECCKVPENGAMECRETGTYVLRFDNSHSWVSGKNLYYFIEVTQQDIADGMHDIYNELL